MKKDKTNLKQQAVYTDESPEIARLFSGTDELPDIVLEKRQEAYRMIREQAASQNTDPSRQKNKSTIFFLGRHIPRAAAIIFACFLATGCAAAAAGLLTRGDMLKNMGTDEIDQYYEEFQSSGLLAYQSTRTLTDEEQERYQILRQRYQFNEAFPEYEIPRLPKGKSYSGKGICLQITDADEENILHLPDTELTDAELLAIIEYNHKQQYSIYETNKKNSLEKGGWESRLAAMTDEDIDYCYAVLFSAMTETSDGYCRRAEDSSMKPQPLSGSETARYNALLEKYEQEGLFPEGEIGVIEYPADYADSGIAVCRYDGNFYLPDRELTDEELLEIIDIRHRAQYALYRIQTDIQLGLRDRYPTSPLKSATPTNLPAMPFADTVETGSLKAVADARIGDTVRFGSYEQDNDPSDGKEAIEWYVLDRTADAMTLLSVKILDGRTYSDKDAYTTWKNSDLRGWLNSEFYQNAFSPSEQSQILSAKLENRDGQDTEDQVYLLSFEELISYFGIDIEELNAFPVNSGQDAHLRGLHCYETMDPRIFAEATEAARANGIRYWTEKLTEDVAKVTNLDFSCANGKSSWWLRTASERQTTSAHAVYENGGIDSLQYVNTEQGVRPVIRIRCE